MKQLFSILLVLALAVLCFVACGNDPILGEGGEESGSSGVSQSESASDSASGSSSESASESTSDSTSESGSDSQQRLPLTSESGLELPEISV